MFPAGGLEPCLFCIGGFNLYLHLTQGFHLRNTKAWYPRLADLYSHFQDFHFYFFLNAQKKQLLDKNGTLSEKNV